MGAKSRADQLLVERGLAASRAKAQSLILAGLVFSGDQRVEKPGQAIPVEAPLEVRGKDHPWVSRGGLKLAHGLQAFGVDPTGATALDIGASTGGFTDVLLTGGAKRVFSVDVGSAQLDWRLRTDSRVVVLERTNARYLTRDLVPDPIDLIVCDASFIGLRTVLPAAMALSAPVATLIALIKPQFEAGRDKVGKGGVVRDAALHAAICAEIEGWLAARPGWTVLGLTESPVTGPKGNREFLIAARRDG